MWHDETNKSNSNKTPQFSLSLPPSPFHPPSPLPLLPLSLSQSYSIFHNHVSLLLLGDWMSMVHIWEGMKKIMESFRQPVTSILALMDFLQLFQTSVFKVLRPSVFRWQPKRSKFTHHSCYFQWIFSGETTTSFLLWFPMHSVDDNPILNHDSLDRHKKAENH